MVAPYTIFPVAIAMNNLIVDDCACNGFDESTWLCFCSKNSDESAQSSSAVNYGIWYG